MQVVRSNTASRDTPFLLRLEITQVTMVKSPRTQTCPLYVRAQGQQMTDPVEPQVTSEKPSNFTASRLERTHSGDKLYW